MDRRTCRMVESRFPAVGSLVMAKIGETHKTSVTVSLLEYNNLEGRLLMSHDPTCVKESHVGRVEPLKVLVVDKRKRYILVDRSSVSFDERYTCEKEYNKRKYVQSVLLSVAEDCGKSLKEMYQLTRWPSFKQLKKLHTADWLKADLGRSLRRFLLKRIKLMRYKSWRIKDPAILRLYTIYQEIASCWAFALVAHTEAFLKLHGRLPKEFYLSVQDLINNVPKTLFEDDGEDGSILELEDVIPVLETKGLVRDEECPLTWSLVDPPRHDMTTAYTVSEVQLIAEGNDTIPDGVGFIDDMAVSYLKRSPLCVSVIWFPSYNGRKDEGMFEPTPAELRAYENDGAVKHPVHTLLLTGEGVDRNGKAFLELQDFNGDINNGDRGYLRFARKPCPIMDFIRLKVY